MRRLRGFRGAVDRFNNMRPLFVLELRMQKKRRKTITEKQWQDAVEAYELGTHNGVQIARQLGVSASAVSRHFKRRGARKACRAAETVAELEAELAAKAARRVRHRSLREAAAMKRLALLNAMVGDMVTTVLAALESGDVPTAASKVAEVRQALRG
jgi:DNA-binding MarR family transcriptional regulator